MEEPCFAAAVLHFKFSVANSFFKAILLFNGMTTNVVAFALSAMRTCRGGVSWW